jgi:hypothetical protein
LPPDLRYARQRTVDVRGGSDNGFTVQNQLSTSQSFWSPQSSWSLVMGAAALVLLLTTAAISFAVIAMAPEAIPDAKPDAPATRRCPECGWIESKRDIASGADNRAIRIQEYTVRMVDGSSRVFTGGPSDRWRLGESLKFIDGPSGAPE